MTNDAFPSSFAVDEEIRTSRSLSPHLPGFKHDLLRIVSWIHSTRACTGGTQAVTGKVSSGREGTLGRGEGQARDLVVRPLKRDSVMFLLCIAVRSNLVWESYKRWESERSELESEFVFPSLRV